MRRLLVLLGVCISVAASAACALPGRAAAADVSQGYPCVVGLPTTDNQGVLLTTTQSVTVIGDNGLAVTHCTFTDTGYSWPYGAFPFSCNIAGIPADIVELRIAGGHTVSLTCVARPS